MVNNRIEQVIGDIQEYIEGCKPQAFSATKIIVDRPQLEEYLDELRQATPEEVKRYQRMLNNRDRILADAKQKAQDVEEKAQAYAERLVEENNITKMAYQKADEIVSAAQKEAEEILGSANSDAEMIRTGAFEYTNDVMKTVLSVITGTIDDAQNQYQALLSSLTEHQQIVNQNLKELNDSRNTFSEDDTDFRIQPQNFFDEN